MTLNPRLFIACVKSITPNKIGGKWYRDFLFGVFLHRPDAPTSKEVYPQELFRGDSKAGRKTMPEHSHTHTHTHDTVTHTHEHSHDDGNHDHTHPNPPPPGTKHSHEHAHDGVTHSHPHEHDDHHDHIHG